MRDEQVEVQMDTMITWAKPADSPPDAFSVVSYPDVRVEQPHPTTALTRTSGADCTRRGSQYFGRAKSRRKYAVRGFLLSLSTEKGSKRHPFGSDRKPPAAHCCSSARFFAPPKLRDPCRVISVTNSATMALVVLPSFCLSSHRNPIRC